MGIFQLSDGSFWEIKYEYEYLYEYHPNVIICPSKGKTLNIERVSSGKAINFNSEIIESQIDGDFNGWEGETIVKLLNGQIWKQSEYFYRYHYAFMPKVLIFKMGGRYKMKVNGISKAITVELLN